jgi:hypothetical protein
MSDRDLFRQSNLESAVSFAELRLRQHVLTSPPSPQFSALLAEHFNLGHIPAAAVHIHS